MTSLVLGFWVSALVVAGREPLEEYQLPSGASVVEARVASVTEEANPTIYRGSLTVTRVFVGDVRVDKAFSLRSRNPGPWLGPSILEPRLQEGQSLLCVVYKRPDSDDEVVCPTRWWFGRPWPVRKGVDSWYDEALGVARSIESYPKLTDRDKQIALLEGAAKSNSVSSASWGIGTLASLASEDQRAYRLLNALVDEPKVPVEGQIALDYALLSQPDAKWRYSEARVAMMKRWAHRPDLSVEDAGRIYSHLNLMAQGDRAPKPDRLLAVLRETLFSKEFPIETARATHWSIAARIPQSQEDDASVFAYVVDVVKSSKDERLRDTALSIVGSLTELSDKQKADLRQLVALDKNPALRTTLEEAIERQRQEALERNRSK